MNTSRLRKTVKPAFDIAAVMAARRVEFGTARMDTSGGQGDAGAGGTDAGGGQGGAGSGEGAGAGSGSGGQATGSGGTGEPGFPANTPVAEMKPEEQTAYWKHQARKHEQRATSRGDYDDLKAKAAKLDEIEAANATEQEKAVKAAREEGEKTATERSTAAGNRTAVQTALTIALTSAGKTEQEASDLLAHTNFDSFVTDGKPDTAAILTHAKSIAGPVTGGGNNGRRGPDHGQGNRGGDSKTKGVAAGAEMFDASRAKKTAASTTTS